MARRLEDGRIQVNDGRIFDKAQVATLILSSIYGDDVSLELAGEILKDCPGPRGIAGSDGFRGPCGLCGSVEPHTHAEG